MSPNLLSESFRLPHSGRVMRTLAGAPPTHQRTFNPPQPPSNNENETVAQKMLSPKQLTAEVNLDYKYSVFIAGQQKFNLTEVREQLILETLPYSDIQLHVF